MTKQEEIRARISSISDHLASAHRGISVFYSDRDAAIAELRNTVTDLKTRWGALWSLLLLSDEFRKPLLYELVDLCSVGHSDLELCRLVLLSIDRKWLEAHVEDPIARVLAASEASGVQDQEYRRFAELLAQISDRLLAAHLQRCRAHPDPDVQEIAEDFEETLPD